MRHVITLLLVATGLVVVSITTAGCGRAATNTAGSVESSSTTQAPTTSASVSSTSELLSTSAAPTSTPTTIAGGLPFPMLVSRYGSLLEVVDAPGILPYSSIPPEEVAAIFKTQVPAYEPDVQGYRLANGDAVVIFGAPLAPPSMTQLTEAFTNTYGGEGREVFAHFYTSSGYLVASKDYANKLGIMALVASETPTLEQAMAAVQEPGFGDIHYK